MWNGTTLINTEIAWYAHIPTFRINRYLGILFLSSPLLLHLPLLSLLIYRLTTWMSGHLARNRQLETIGLGFVWKAEFSQVVWGLGVGSRRSWASESLLKSCSPDVKIWKKLFIGFLALFKSCITYTTYHKRKKRSIGKVMSTFCRMMYFFMSQLSLIILICQRKHMLETFENLPARTCACTQHTHTFHYHSCVARVWNAYFWTWHSSFVHKTEQAVQKKKRSFVSPSLISALFQLLFVED